MPIGQAIRSPGHAGRGRPRYRRPRTRQASKPLTGIAAVLVFAGVAALGQEAGSAGNADIDVTTLSSISRKAEVAGQLMPARSMPVCASGRRVTCIVDGDTFWMEGVKYRIANIDTPELKGRCKAEKAIAIRARNRLEQLMSGEPFTLSMIGTDPHGRTLVLVSSTDGDLGETLVSEGLAEVWGGAFIDWCSG